jgi:methanogenic corrinoid protein MtbC1
MPLPGDNHTFGVAMVEDFLRLAGWDVWCGIGAAQGEALRLIGHTWFALLGVSISREEQVPALTREITRMRRASCNRNLGVMAGGPPFSRDPGLAQRVGADATASDAAQAAATAEQMLGLLPTIP